MREVAAAQLDEFGIQMGGDIPGREARVEAEENDWRGRVAEERFWKQFQMNLRRCRSIPVKSLDGARIISKNVWRATW